MNGTRAGVVATLACLSATGALAAEGPSAPPHEPPPAPAKAAAGPVCDLIAEAAAAHRLPLGYFTRLIWRESRFHPNALSPAGAQGVAQFMPATAAERGLANPFATREALVQSAGFLDELRSTFGNLGLAAAAYNAGPGRVSRWLAGQAELPQETLDYVRAITGQEADAWRAKPPPDLRGDTEFSCERYATLASREAPAARPPGRPWAVILLGSPQRDKVMVEYRAVQGRFVGVLGGLEPTVAYKRISGMQIPRYIVQIERDTREAADALCSRLLRAGGTCFVLANRG